MVKDGCPATLCKRDVPITWPLAFLHLVAESARMGLRELDRLDAAAEKGRALAARSDKRSRLPDAIEALLRYPALTPNALAAEAREPSDEAFLQINKTFVNGVAGSRVARVTPWRSGFQP